MSDAPTHVDDTVAAYFSAWNATTDQRADAVAGAFSVDAYYCDGSAEATGRGQIVEMMTGVMEQFEGSSFALSSPIDAHHQQARFAWRMSDSAGETLIEGIDAVRFDDDGRISTALGFFGVGLPEPTPEAATGPPTA